MNWIIILISVLLAASGVYQEVRRSNKARLTWRLIALILSIAALACLVLPVGCYTNSKTSDKNHINLITKGFNVDSLKNYENGNTFTLDTDIARSYPKAILISDITGIYTDSISRPYVSIWGYGLDAATLKQLKGTPVSFHPAPIPNGVTAINWTGSVKAGSPLQVQGTIQNNGRPFSLVLKGLNTGLDSVQIASGASIPFNLTTTPKYTGKAIYLLEGIRDKDTLFKEKLPVIIEKNLPLKVLMLSASPDFENKFLKTWLGNNGYGVASRTVVTKGKYGQDFVNMDKLDLAHLTGGIFQKFDMVAADLSAIKALSPAESAALQQEVNSRGIGLIVRADSSADKTVSWAQRNFQLKRQNRQATQLALNIRGKGPTAKLTVDPQSIAEQGDIQPLVTDEHGNLLAAKTLSGTGNVVFSVINNSYSWMLAGNKENYFALWSLLINQAARHGQETENWQMGTQLPVVGQPVKLNHYTASADEHAAIDQTDIAPVQNPDIPFEWQRTYWPVQSGWQEAKASNGAPYPWFVWQAGDWQSLKAVQYINATKQYVQSTAAAASVTMQIQAQKQWVAFPKVVFYVLFLVSLAFLWAERKYTGY